MLFFFLFCGLIFCFDWFVGFMYIVFFLLFIDYLDNVKFVVFFDSN